MADTKAVYSVRADESTIAQIKEVTEQFPNANDAFRALLNSYEMSQAKSVLHGQETSIDDFQSHVDSLLRAYISVLDLTANTEQRVRQDFNELLESKDKIIADLQKRLEEAESLANEAAKAESEAEQRAAERDEEATRQIAEYMTQAERAMQDKEQAEKNVHTYEQVLRENNERIEEMKAKLIENEHTITDAEQREKQIKDALTKAQMDLKEALDGLFAEKSEHKLDMIRAEAEVEKARNAEKDKYIEALSVKTSTIEKLMVEKNALNEQIFQLKTQLAKYEIND